MGIKDTVFGWLRSTPAKSDELEDAETDEAEREYAAAEGRRDRGAPVRHQARRVRVGPARAAR